MVTKSKLVRIIKGYRKMTNLIMKAELYPHDDIDADRWCDEMCNLDDEADRIIRRQNAESGGRKSTA